MLLECYQHSEPCLNDILFMSPFLTFSIRKKIYVCSTWLEPHLAAFFTSYKMLPDLYSWPIFSSSRAKGKQRREAQCRTHVRCSVTERGSKSVANLLLLVPVSDSHHLTYHHFRKWSPVKLALVCINESVTKICFWPPNLYNSYSHIWGFKQIYLLLSPRMNF